MDRVISLARTPERLARFREVNGHFEVEQKEAIDGLKLDRDVLWALNWIDPALEYTPGALGCLVSHIQFWQDVANAGEVGTIFEDDAVLHRDFEEWRRWFLAMVPDDWHILLWGFNFDAGLIYKLPGGIPCATFPSQGALKQSIGAFQVSNTIGSDIHPILANMGTIAYSLSPSGARFLLENALPVRPFTRRIPNGTEWPNTGVDMVLNNLYDRMNAFVCFPPLVVTPNDNEASTTLR